MVILDIINNDLKDSKYDSNLVCNIMDKLTEHNISFTVASELCAGEEIKNAITIKKDLERKSLNRSAEDCNCLNDYCIHNNLDSDKTISYEFLKEYVSEDAWINAADDIVNNILKHNKRQTERLEPPSFEMGDFQYIVQDGDSLFDLAARYNTTPERIKAKNALPTDEIYPGQLLILDGPKTITETIRYIVRAGDKLSAIAQDYNTTVEDLRKFNNLTEDNLKIGQVLVINPVAQFQSPIRYIVRSGDSLYSIARRYNITVKELKKLNNLDSNFLKVGQELFIPE